MPPEKMSRRQFLAKSVTVAWGLAATSILIACGPTPTPEEIKEVVKETVIVEKQVNPTGVLAWPIDCIPGETCSNTIGYPDIDKDGVAFNCGQPGYSGHEGTDIRITWEQMDNGVSVFAAADGQVLWVFDGRYDRCPDSHPDCHPPGHTVCTEVGDYCGTGSCCCFWCFAGGNVIVIRHFDVNGVFATRYDHLRTNSILVSPGDFVSKGQKIAEVGSAGASSGPHLHFEIWGTGFYELADPWAGPCGPNFDGPLWDYQIPWASSGNIPVYAPGVPFQRYEVSSANENQYVYLPIRLRTR